MRGRGIASPLWNLFMIPFTLYVKIATNLDM